MNLGHCLKGGGSCEGNGRDCRANAPGDTRGAARAGCGAGDLEHNLFLGGADLNGPKGRWEVGGPEHHVSRWVGLELQGYW